KILGLQAQEAAQQVAVAHQAPVQRHRWRVRHRGGGGGSEEHPEATKERGKQLLGADQPNCGVAIPNVPTVQVARNPVLTVVADVDDDGDHGGEEEWDTQLGMDPAELAVRANLGRREPQIPQPLGRAAQGPPAAASAVPPATATTGDLDSPRAVGTRAGQLDRGKGQESQVDSAGEKGVVSDFRSEEPPRVNTAQVAGTSGQPTAADEESQPVNQEGVSRGEHFARPSIEAQEAANLETDDRFSGTGEDVDVEEAMSEAGEEEDSEMMPGVNEVEEEGDAQENAELVASLRQAAEELQSAVDAFHSENDDVELDVRQGQIRILRQILFVNKSDSFLPGSDSEALIKRVAAGMVILTSAGHKFEFNIDGHTASANVKLSEMRAKRVMAELALNGLDGKLLHARWFSNSKMHSRGNKDPLNKRVEFSIHRKHQRTGNLSGRSAGKSVSGRQSGRQNRSSGPRKP
ncbi:hypothetical protein CYMTET_23873, partial [Cymbomonas tetramitiformis]